MNEQQLAAAATNVVAKLQALQAGLTSDERVALAAALHSIGAAAAGAAEDVTGYLLRGLIGGHVARPSGMGDVAVEMLTLSVQHAHPVGRR